MQLKAQSHLETLKLKHAAIEARIADEDRRPRPDEAALARLKLEKLRLKEHIERVRSNGNAA